MTTLARSIFANAIRYFRDEIRHYVALAREPGIPASVRGFRLRHARALAERCRHTWLEIRAANRAASNPATPPAPRLILDL